MPVAMAKLITSSLNIAMNLFAKAIQDDSFAS
jgi:hypothetical protein